MKTYFHGEVVCKKINVLPEGIKKVKPKEKRYIVAPSETTGNHHCIEALENAEMYEKDGVFYLRNESPVKLYCVDESRHDTEVLEPGVWKIDRANTYDYLADMTRKVAD